MLNDHRAKTLHNIAGISCDTSASADAINPATGALIGRFAVGGEEEAQIAIAAARAAFDTTTWPQNPRLRQMVLLRWADALERDQSSLAALLTETNGKPLVHALGEIGVAISEIRYYAGLARHNPGHALELAPGEFSMMLREPAGVAALIIPWNAPAVLLVRALAPAMAVGCTSVITAAPQTALFTGACLAPLFADPQMPKGAVNLLFETGHDVAQSLTAHADVDMISFTGSNLVGRKIMQAAAPTMKKLSLELGSKSCCLAMQDVDIDAIAPKLAAALLIISGQQCTAARRVLVHEKRLAEMKSALSAALSATRIGNGMESGVAMGPLIDAASRDKVWCEIEESFDLADEVVLRGAKLAGPTGSAFIAPSLIFHADPNASFCQDENFGPLLVLESFGSENEAVAKANNTVYGLSASVWTARGDVAWRLGRALRNGAVWINDHNKLCAEAETGGYRRSGLGRLHGYDALLDFSELKHVYQSVGVVGSE